MLKPSTLIRYLCQMEPVAHFGIRSDEKDFLITIKWTNGSTQNFEINSLDQEFKIKQKQ